MLSPYGEHILEVKVHVLVTTTLRSEYRTRIERRSS